VMLVDLATKCFTSVSTHTKEARGDGSV
jgi:hypothetical protein